MAGLRIVEVIPVRSGAGKRKTASGRISVLMRAGTMLGFFLACPGWAQTEGPAAIAAPLQPPGWSELSVPQKIVLAPLADEWDSLGSLSRKLWLEFAAHFSSLSPEEQRRAQGQMRKWRKLTPEERRAARENYKSARRLSTGQRQELKQKWERYSSLPGEEKEKLKQRAAGRLTRPPARAVPVAYGTFPADGRPLPLWRPGVSIPYRALPPARRSLADSTANTEK
jgi:hypothetical protein